MRTNIVLIDFENVQPETLVPLADVPVRLIVFVGPLQTKIPFEFANAMQRLGNKAEYIKMTRSGPNALDFHIAFYIGQMVSQHTDARFYIISKDAGFDPLIEHLKSKKIFATRVCSMDSLQIFKTETNKPVQDRAELFIAKLSDPKYPRPKTVQALTRSLGTFLGNQTSEGELARLMKSIQERRIVIISDGKISYPVDTRPTPTSSKT